MNVSNSFVSQTAFLLVLCPYALDLGPLPRNKIGQSLSFSPFESIVMAKSHVLSFRAGKVDWARYPHPKMHVRNFVVEGCRVD